MNGESKMDPRLVDLAGLERRPTESWRKRGWWGRPPMWERVRDVAANTPGKPAVIEVRIDPQAITPTTTLDAIRAGSRR